MGMCHLVVLSMTSLPPPSPRLLLQHKPRPLSEVGLPFVSLYI